MLREALSLLGSRFVPKALFTVLVLSAASVVGFSQTPQPKAPIRVLQFRLEMDSLEPARITVKEGIYEIRVVNGLVMAPIRVDLDDDKATRVAAGETKGKGVRSKMLVRLTPGKRYLSVRGRPQWRSEITVEKQ